MAAARISSISIVPGFDRARWQLVIDWLAVGVAVSLPWSTSATSILIVLWLIALLPTLDVESLRRTLTTAAGFLPVALWLLAAIGMLWAGTDVSWPERFGGLNGFHRLLLIPLVLLHFRRSAHGLWVIYGYFFATLALLIASWGLALIPGLSWRGHGFGVPAKDYVYQSMEFLLCAFALLGYACAAGRAQHWRRVAGFVALALLFLANMFFVNTSRTALFAAPILLLVLGWRELRWKGVCGAVLLGAIVAGSVWFGSPYMRARLTTSFHDWQAYRVGDAPNSTGLHLEFLRKSLIFIEAAPIAGHGTGSIPQQFRNAAVAQGGASSAAAVNPHNQIFAVAIQLGLIGAAVLAAMWIAHLLLFTGGGPLPWVGMAVVVENIASSTFNSHLFDFTSGWLYVFGVGAVGGMMLRKRDSMPGAADAA
jgi:O-antigen ligase